MAISDENRFFKFLWRVNAVLIAFFAVAGFLVASFVFYKFVSEVTRERSVRNVVNLSPQSVEKEKFELGHPDMIEASDYIKIPLMRLQNYGDNYFSKSASSEVNFLFFNIKDRSSRWLAPTNSQLIQMDFLVYDTLRTDTHSDKNQVPRKPLRFIFKVVEADTDENGRMTVKDKTSVFTSGIDGSGYTRLVEAADEVLMIRQTTDEQFMVIYNKDGQAYYQGFDVRDAKPVFDGKIDVLDPSANAAP